VCLAATRLLDTVGDIAVAEEPKSLEREARTRTVPHELLPAEIIVGLDPHSGLDVEAGDIHRHWTSPPGR
jgi:hypothetical protein